MSMAEFSSSLPVNKTVRWQLLYARYFFVAMAFIFIVMAVVGFGQDYQMIYAQHITIFWFAHVHGALLTAWLLIFLTQTILAARGNLAFHRKLGLFAVAIGLLVWISMGIVIFHAHIGYPPHDKIAWAIVLFLVLIMNLFGLFFGWGVMVRKNAASHKRLLFLATLMLITAGFNRVLLYAGVDPTIHSLPLPGPATPSVSGEPWTAFMLYNDLLLLTLFVYDFVTVRRIHKITLTATSIIVGTQFILTMFWRFLR